MGFWGFGVLGLGGQAGIKGHIHLEDRAMVAAKSGVHTNLKKGEIVSGYPAIPHKEWLKASSIFTKLPQLMKEMREAKKLLTALQQGLSTTDKTKD